MVELPNIKANSRCIFNEFGPNIDEFEFGANYVSQSHVQAWLNNKLMVEGSDYTWLTNDTTIKVTKPRDKGSVIEMVRITLPSSPVTPTELIYMIEEKRDELELRCQFTKCT